MDSPSIGKSKTTSVESQLLNSISSKKSQNKQRSQEVSGRSDSVEVGMQNIYKSLTVLADNIVKKLDELLKKDLPEGVRSLDPAEHTSEKTAQRIVDGVTALFPIFAKQNQNLEGEALLSKFMETIRGGIKQGYNESVTILGDIGAFEISGVQDAIKETMRLVEEKLVAFEENFRTSLPPKSEENTPKEKPPQA